MLNRKDVKKILTEKLQYKNGTIEKIEEDNLDDSYSHLVYRISWKGGMSFSVYLGPTYLWYYVERNGESLDQRGTGKLDDPVLSMMQNMICEIENGKYKTKKTMSERLAKIIQDRQLTSCMNDTKWKELFSSIEKSEDIIQYKTLWDEVAPEVYWCLLGDEELDYMKTSWIEWLKIRGHIEKTFRSGRLMEPKVEKTDIHDKVEDVLKKYSIPYEYDPEEDCYVIYGYR